MLVPVRIFDDHLDVRIDGLGRPSTRFLATSRIVSRRYWVQLPPPLAAMSASLLQSVKKKSSRMISSNCPAVYPTISLSFRRSAGCYNRTTGRGCVRWPPSRCRRRRGCPGFQKTVWRWRSFPVRNDAITVGLQIDLVHLQLAADVVPVVGELYEIVICCTS